MKSGIEDSETGETDITVKQALQKMLEAALLPKYTTSQHINIQAHNFYRDKTVINVVESMMSGIIIDVDHGAGETDIDMVKQAFKIILEGALPPKYNTYKHIYIKTHDFYREKDLNKKTVRDIIEFMMTKINDVEDPQAGETDITVKQAFQKILEDAFSPKYSTHKNTNIQIHNFYREKDLNKETVRDVVEWMMSIINNIVDPEASEANITVKQVFQRILAADLPPKYITHQLIKIHIYNNYRKEERVRQFKEVKKVMLKRKVVVGYSKEAPW